MPNGYKRFQEKRGKQTFRRNLKDRQKVYSIEGDRIGATPKKFRDYIDQATIQSNHFLETKRTPSQRYRNS